MCGNRDWLQLSGKMYFANQVLSTFFLHFYLIVTCSSQRILVYLFYFLFCLPPLLIIFSICLCQSVIHSVSQSINQSVSQSVCLSKKHHLFIHLHPSLHASLHASSSIFICLFINLQPSSALSDVHTVHT